MPGFSSGRPINPNRVAVYIRWSTDEQGQGTTLLVQREACAHYCRSQGWMFQEDLVFVDEGYSGGDLDRPALGELRAAVQGGRVECVVVYKLDRLSRSLLDCIALVRQEWGGRCALYSTRENFDTNSPVGQMVFNILVSFAEFERNVIRERTLGGKRKRAEQGRNAGQRYPHGYQKGAGGGLALDGWDPERRCLTGPAAVVGRIFADFLSGAGTVSIATRLNAEGIPAPMGGQWRFGAIARILDNPIYAGRYEYGRRLRQRDLGEVEAGRTVVGTVPAIISEADFQRVQVRRRERAARPPRSLHSDFLLSGIAACRACGGRINGTTARHKRYYVCANRAGRKACDCAWMDAANLEGALLAELKATLARPDTRSQLERFAAEMEQLIGEYAHAVRLATAQVPGVQRKQKRLDAAFFAGSLDPEIYNSRAQGLAADLAQAEEMLRRARMALYQAKDVAAAGEPLQDAAQCVDAWAELSFEEQKQLLREATDSLTVYQPGAPRGNRQGQPPPPVVEWRPRLA